MKKHIATVFVGLTLLAATSMADASDWGHGGVHASVSIGVPIGNYGYAVVNTGPAYYPAPVYYAAPYYYAPRPVYYNGGYAQGWKHGNKRHGHHDNGHDYYEGHGHGH